MIAFNQKHNLFIWSGPYDQRSVPQKAGFTWHEEGKAWVTPSPFIACLLHGQADSLAKARLNTLAHNIKASAVHEEDPLSLFRIPLPPGRELYPFQAAGVEYMTTQILAGRRAVACFDEQGLGKTVQAIGVANVLGLSKLAVVCPAHLRLNWEREINNWHVHNKGLKVILSGADDPEPQISCAASYELSKKLQEFKPELLIIDEAHYIKTPGTKRTSNVLGNAEQKIKGLVSDTLTIFLDGTPLPNGKPNELWPILYKCAPDAISYMKLWPFIQRFCELWQDGDDYKVVGAKNKKELFIRLRGSGFMLRRLKKDVLKDLPPKIYKMVIFPQDSTTRKIVDKESEFNEKEIILHGAPVGTVLPELRREMGIAKVENSLRYIVDLLEGGVKKVVVFGHHRDVCFGLKEGLKKYRPVIYIGGMSDKNKMLAETTFQKDSSCRVFVGNEAAEEGITLTAAQNVIDVEPEWVPGKSDQRYDRLHRITQTGNVVIHILVVEGSLDAKILGSAANKKKDSKEVLDGK